MITTIRIGTIMVLLTAAAFVSLEFGVVRYYSSGAYFLTVQVESESGQIQSVYCKALDRRKPGERVLPSSDSLDRYYEHPSKSDPFDGQPLSVHVITDTRESSFFQRTVGWSQQESLAVLVQMLDGTRIEKIVSIPDGRKTKTMTVHFP
jgi:hypothetical protein